MAVKPALEQPEKNTQRDPGEKGWTCYYCGKKGHLKQECPQASKLPPAPCLVCKGPYWRRDCPLRCRPQGSDSQDNQDRRCLGVPTQAPILIIPEEPRVLITWGGQSVDSFWTPRKLTLCSLKPRSTFLPIHYCNGTVRTSQRLLFQSSFKLQLGLLLFSHEFLILPEFHSPLLAKDILNKVQASVFMNMELALSLPLIEQNVNSRVWTDGKTMSWAQNTVPVIIKLNDPDLFSHQKQYPLKPKVNWMGKILLY